MTDDRRQTDGRATAYGSRSLKTKRHSVERILPPYCGIGGKPTLLFEFFLTYLLHCGTGRGVILSHFVKIGFPNFIFSFSATVCKTVRAILSDCCLSVSLSRL